MRRKPVRLKTKQTLQFGKLEMTVSCIIIPIDPIRIITHVWLKCQLCRIGRTQAPLPSKNSESCFRCIIVQLTWNSDADDVPLVISSSIDLYNTFIGMGSGNSLFNMQLVKYFSGEGRRPCPLLKYVTLLSMPFSILSIKWCRWRLFSLEW